MNAPTSPLFYAALALSGGWPCVDRVARRHGEIVMVCMTCRTVYGIVQPTASGTGGRSDGLCNGCLERHYPDDGRVYEEGDGR